MVGSESALFPSLANGNSPHRSGNSLGSAKLSLSSFARFFMGSPRLDRQNGILARAVGVAVGRRSGGRLATTLVATIFIIIIIFSPRFFPVFLRRHLFS